MDHFYKVVTHALEIAIVLLVAWLITSQINLGPGTEEALAIILAALMKLIRTLPVIPVPDYVNDIESKPKK